VTWDVVLGYFTGLHLLDPALDLATLLRTAAVVHTCDAIMCRLFAHNNGYPKNLWTALGFVFGIWALAVLILLPKRPRPSSLAPRPSSLTPTGPGSAGGATGRDRGSR
jgi:hypothetical protein